MGKDIPQAVTLGSIEGNVDGTAEYQQFGPIDGLEYVAIEGYEVPFDDADYQKKFKDNMETRIHHLNTTLAKEEAPHDLPAEITNSIQKVIDQVK